ncbi:MAG: TetR/AcrR family transcriptional regulator [Stellaceae bacterium]
MVQVKKAQVRDAILKSAFRQFKREGYMTTTTAQIAAGAHVSESNLYIYFDSKFEILFALCDPWMRERVRRLEERLAGESDARRRLRIILTVLWREMPSDDNGFPNNLMQALATTARREGYRPDLLRWIEERIETLILESLPEPSRRRLAQGGLAHLLMMAQDGYVLNYYLNPASICGDATVELMCDLLLGTFPA